MSASTTSLRMRRTDRGRAERAAVLAGATAAPSALRTKPVSSGASQQHQQHLRALYGQVTDQGHTASTRSKTTRAAEDEAEITGGW